MSGEITVPTLAFALFPGRFIDRETDWESFNLGNWARNEYTYEGDPMWYDHAKAPRDLIDKGSGDCGDWARLAASYAAARGDAVKVSTMVDYSRPWDAHVVAHTDIAVYSNGEIVYEDIEDYVARTRYDWYFTRKASGGQ